MADEEKPAVEPDGEDSTTEAIDESRRRWMKTATIAIGGVISVITAFPLIRYFWYPVGRKTVKSTGEPIHVMSVYDLELDAPPVRVAVSADAVRDAWSTSDNVPLGAVWLRKVKEGDGEKIIAFSATCPHLGCSVGYDERKDAYRCPCHKSAFSIDGAKQSGPSKRGLDPLEAIVEGDRILIRWKKYKADIAERQEV